MRTTKLFSLLLALILTVACFTLSVAAATEQEVLETVYQLDELKMYEPHNNYSFKMWKNEYAAINDFSLMENAVYIECDVFGNLDTYQAPDTTLAIIAKNFLHPSNSYQPVLVWTAPYDGKISVNTTYSAPKNGGKLEDFPEMFIYFDQEIQHQQITSQEEVVVDLTFDVKAGEQVMWSVNAGTDMSDDTTLMLSRVWYTEVDITSGTEAPETNDTQAPETSDTKAPETNKDTEAPATNAPATGADTKAPETNDTTAEPASGLPVGAIIGIVAAVVVVVVVVVIVVKKKKA